jgi:sugar (pentulose or hexulose) kinase
MEIKMAAIDLDGTLLRDDMSISDFSKDIIRKAERRGIRIVLATGRMFDAARPKAEELGLSVNTKVVCGGGDGPCSALGAGSTENGQMFLSYGTSAWIAGTSDEVFLDKDRTLICFGHVIPGKYMPCGTMQAAGSSYSYIRHAMCGEEEVTAEKEGVSIYDVMNRLVEQSPAGAKGLVGGYTEGQTRGF